MSNVFDDDIKKWDIAWKEWYDVCALNRCQIETIEMLCNLIRKRMKDIVDCCEKYDLDAIYQSYIDNISLYLQQYNSSFDPNYQKLFLLMEGALFPEDTPENRNERKKRKKEKLKYAEKKTTEGKYSYMGFLFITDFIKVSIGLFQGKGIKRMLNKYDPYLEDNQESKDDIYNSIDESEALEIAKKFVPIYWNEIKEEKERAALYAYLHHAKMSDRALHRIVGVPEGTSTFSHWGHSLAGERIVRFFKKKLKYKDGEITDVILGAFRNELCLYSEEWACKSEIAKKMKGMGK